MTELSRFDRGWARARLRGTWVEIDAGDTAHARGMPEEIATHLASTRMSAPTVPLDATEFAGWRFHAIARHRTAVHRGSEPDEQRTAIVVASAPVREQGPISIVTTPKSLSIDTHGLLGALARPVAHGVTVDDLPVAFSNGSAAVLMHEAIGHPAERGMPHVGWPSWLEVTDDPLAASLGYLPLDDCGRPTSRRDLTRGDSPSALRRWSFRDTPIVRMSNLCVMGSGRPLRLPSKRIDVHLVDQGSWDPLSDQIALRICLSELVDGSERSPLPRFTLRFTRRELAARLVGWFGDATSYPGVICSDEGQTLPVGSIAIGALVTPR